MAVKLKKGEPWGVEANKVMRKRNSGRENIREAERLRETE